MIVRLVLIMVILLQTTCAIWGANFLNNPSFEDHPLGLSHGEGVWWEHSWRYFSVNGAGGSFLTVSPGRTGNIAIRLARTSTNGDMGLDRDGFLVPVSAGVRYRASFWAKSPSGSSLKLVLAAHDSSGTWLGQHKETIFTLGSEYSRYYTDYIPPTGTAFINFGLRISGTGTVYIDDCEFDVAPPEPLTTPTITYPVNEQVDSFKPTIGFKGSGHDAFQVMITKDSNVVWDSGTIVGSNFSINCPVSLQPTTSYKVKVRLRRGAEWSNYSSESDFTTPPGPLVRIISPAEADSPRGPDITVRWVSDSPSGIIAQTLTLDNGNPISLSNTASSYTLSDIAEGMHTIVLAATSAEGTATDMSRFYVRITPAESGTIYYHDLSYVLNYNRSDPTQRKLAYDIPMAVYALQGLVNKSGPRLWIKQFSEDTTWWNRMREKGNWLANKTVVTIPTGFNNLVTLFNTFRTDINGVVLWDPDVYATANVACTVAGADNLIPIRYDPTPGSVYSTLVANGPRLPVVVDLTGKFTGSGVIWGTNIPSTGSKKCDAYIWAKVNYLETGKSNPEILMYAVDGYWLEAWNMVGNPGHTLPCRDFVIQNKGFFFDLNVWADETPVDDPNQPLGTDLATLRSILYAAAIRAPGMVHVVGFVPWPMKYTTWGNGAAGGTHDPVPTEWEYARWLSHYNAYMDADAYNIVDMANASIYCQFPLPDRLVQNRQLSLVDLRKLGYVDKNKVVSPLNFLNIYMGDYDSACWVQKMAYARWDDSNRGTIPISWAFNPNHIRRIAAVMEYYYRTRSDLDSFIAGDCGAGYVNPTCLFGTRLSGLPSAKDIWIQHNLKYNRATSIKIAGFLINGTNGPVTQEADEMYAQFSPYGTFSQPLWYPQGNHMVGSMPALLQKRDLTGTLSTDADIVFGDGMYQGPTFLNYRTVLQWPSYVKNLYNTVLGKDAAVPWALVDAHVYAALASQFMGKTPDARATYTFHILPSSTVEIGKSLTGTIGVRNDGWVDWDSSYSLLLTWKQGTRTVKTTTIPLPRGVPSGTGIVLDFNCTPPEIPGTYTFTYEMARNGTGFSALGDYAWDKTVTVKAPATGYRTSDAKAYPDGTQVSVWDAVVTAGTDQMVGTFYIEDDDRASGIKVYGASGIAVSEGDRVGVQGKLSTMSTERMLINPILVYKSSGVTLQPLAMTTGAVGGSDLNVFTPGIPGKVGVHNTGLLVTVWGHVTFADTTAKYFYLDDGCSLSDGSGCVGLRIDAGGLVSGNTVVLPLQGQYVVVTGISSRKSIGGVAVPVVRVRKQSDIRIASG